MKTVSAFVYPYRHSSQYLFQMWIHAVPQKKCRSVNKLTENGLCVVPKKKRFVLKIWDTFIRNGELMNKKTFQRDFEKAEECYCAGDLSASEHITRDVIDSHGTNPDAVYFLGLIQHQAGQYAEATASLSQAIALLHDNPTYYNTMGMVMRIRGEMNNAAPCFDKTLQLKLDYLLALYNRAGNLPWSGRFYAGTYLLSPCDG